MSPSSKKFLRDNLLGISLTLIGLLCAAAVTVAYLNRSSYSRFALAEGKVLDGPDIKALQTLNNAYERISQAMTPAIVSIQSTQVVKVQASPFFMDPLFRQFFGNQLQSRTATMPVRKTPSKVPAPPIEATGAPSPRIRSRLSRSAPIKVPMQPEM